MRASEKIDSVMEALDLHLRQWEWSDSQGHAELWYNFAGGYGNSNHRDNRVREPNWQELSGEVFAEIDAKAMNEGRTIFITEDIIDVISQAADSMPPVPLRPDRIPEPNGVLILAKPLPYWNPHDGLDSMPIRAIAWVETKVELPEAGRTGDGITLIPYTDMAAVQALRVKMGGESWIDEWGVAPPFYPLDATGWGYGMDWVEGEEGEEYAESKQAPHIAQLRRWLLALWVFMSDEIVPVDRHPHLPRSSRRRAERSKKMLEDGIATVVHLRKKQWSERERPEGEENEDQEPIEWSHSWIVRGHWRRLRNPDTGKFDGRVTWVKPHIKGDGPLVLKERLILVHR